MAKKGLGKGLGALFADTTPQTENKQVSIQDIEQIKDRDGKQDREGIKHGENSAEKTGASPSLETGENLKVKISYVEPNIHQPRKHFREEELAELAESIKQYGILQPILVKKIGTDRYEIIAGERRWRAAQICGLTEVPVLIREYSDREAMEISIIENIQRSDLNPIEEALGYRALIDEYGLTQEEVASKVSKNRSTITNALRLLKLEERVRTMVSEGILSTGHAKVLLSVPDQDMQYKLAQEIILKGMNIRELEKQVKLIDKKAIKKTVLPAEDRDYSLFFKEYEERIRLLLGTKVHINRKDKNKGRIEIEYYSQSELERIMEVLYKSGRNET